METQVKLEHKVSFGWLIFLSSALGMMFGSGGNALVAKKLGEGKHREAQEDFTLLMIEAFLFSMMVYGCP